MNRRRRCNEPLIPACAVPWLVAGLAFAALSVAWIAEFGFGLRPCYLCYLQRDAYWTAMVLALAAIPFVQRPKLGAFILGLAGLGALTGAGIALYHVGVEQKWWAGSDVCVGTDLAGLSGGDFSSAILNAPLMRCDEAVWSLFGISMAGYNILYALGLAALALWGAWRILAASRR